MSYVGAYDLAGNVREWTLTTGSQGRVIAGGSWNEAPFAVLEMNTGANSPLDRSPGNGFRLAITRDSPEAAELARTPLSPAPEIVPREPVSDEVFAALSRVFDYNAQAPLNAAIESRDETRLWTRERITFDAAYGQDRVTLYLYLPRNTERPYQTVVFWPGADALSMREFEDSSLLLDFVVKSGRAVAFPVYLATFDRGPVSLASNPPDPRELLTVLVNTVRDFRRSLDYLESRTDIDPARFGIFGHSWGGAMSAVVLAHEPRIRAAVGYVAYVPPPTLVPWGEPELDTVNSLPRVDVPYLMLNGQFDTAIPPGSDEAFYRLLGTPEEDKRHIVEPGGHFVPTETLIRETLGWYDRYLGVPRNIVTPGGS